MASAAARAHLVLLEDEVEADGHGKAPKGNVKYPPRREAKAQVVVLLVLCPLLDRGVAGGRGWRAQRVGWESAGRRDQGAER